MAFEPEDIRCTGICGVRRTTGITSRQDSAEKYADGNSARRSVSEEPADNFAIYQLRRDQGLADYRFASLAELQHDRLSVNRQNYELVYGTAHTRAIANSTSSMSNSTSIIHGFYRALLSVSDIVALKQNGEVSCHYVDSVGHEDVPSFIQRKIPKNAEMATEDDYDSIDGIINNGPKETVAELEQQAKSGQPISLLDLAEAAHREDQQEKKKSVLEQLHAPTQQEPKISAPKKSAEREI